VSESSGCLDLSDSTSKYSLSRTHFDMNKFGKPTEEDFETVSEVVKKMVGASHELIVARSQGDYALRLCSMILRLTVAADHSKNKVDFSPEGLPIVGQCVTCNREMRNLESLFLEGQFAANQQRLVVVHDLGGVGKT
jgi:hypothetical protein